jgi:M6 family metalloprotease-like protein
LTNAFFVCFLALAVSEAWCGDVLSSAPITRRFLGGVPAFNDFCAPATGCQAQPLFASDALRVLCLLVDTADLSYTGTPNQFETYRQAKLAEYEANCDAYWQEASYGFVAVQIDMPAELFSLKGNFQDYFNRGFVAASLTTTGLSFPLTLDGSELALLHVRDAGGRNIDVELQPPAATYASIDALASACQEIFDDVPGVPSDWVECTSSSGELQIALVEDEVDEGSFIRVRDGDSLDELGLDGPLESPREDNTPPRLVGKSVPGGFPLALAGTEAVTIELRDGQTYPLTRRYTVSFPAGSLDRDELSDLVLDVLNAELFPPWVTALDAGADRLAFELSGAIPGDDAAMRVVAGTGLEALGLDGPVRVDGVIHTDKNDTVRGYRPGIVEEAVRLYALERAAEEGIDLTCGNDEDDLDAILDAELGDYDSFMVLFVEDLDGDGTSDIPSGKRASASASNTFQIRISDTTVACLSYVYEYDFSGGLMIGPGTSDWTTWAHELGHNLGFEDLYTQSWHLNLDPNFDEANDWDIMDRNSSASHASGWHKLRKEGWIPQDAIADVDPPPAGVTETHLFTLVPLEYEFQDYSGVGDGTYPERQLVRLRLSDEHWVLIENRQPGEMFSQSLPNDADGDCSAAPSGSERGGLLVTDTCNPDGEFFCGARPRVVVLNPDGNPSAVCTNARGIGPEESLDLATTTPEAYDGIVVRDLGSVAGPAGSPEARRVEIEWGPGDFVELEIRPWDAPDFYGTHDIWVDWPGNGEEDYPGDPPLGSGDSAHVNSLNYLYARVHNRGTVDAVAVEVEMAVNTPGGVGDTGDFVPLADTVTHDIPAGSHADFAFEWEPTSGDHTCVRARILSDQSPLGDVDFLNNEAQENIWCFTPSSASPYAPFDFTFRVNSVFDVPVNVLLQATGLRRGVDLLLERVQLHLRPDETASVKGRFFVNDVMIPPSLLAEERFSQLQLHALLETPDSYLPFGGATIELRPGFRSTLHFDGLDCDVRNPESTVVRGRLEGPLAAGEKVDGSIEMPGRRFFGSTTTTDAQGRFALVFSGVPQDAGRLMLYYFPGRMAASTLGPLVLDTRPQRPRFRLGFAGPCGERINGPPGAPFTFLADCTLATEGNPCSAGAQGWSLGVQATGADIAGITTSGTVGADAANGPPGLRTAGFELSQLTSGRGNEGAISVVVLSFISPVTLPPDGTVTVARLTLLSRFPARPGACSEVGLEYVDGLVGTRGPVRNSVSYRGSLVDPELETCNFVLCEGTAPVPNWTAYDANGDGSFDISDPVSHLGQLFLGSREPACLEALDFNGDRARDISDPVAALNHLFLGGPGPRGGAGCRVYPTCRQSEACRGAR